MRISTPLSTSKTAALSRVVDAVSYGYVHHTQGVINKNKMQQLAQKFHDRYEIGCTVSQRHTRKKKSQANAKLVLHSSSASHNDVSWLLLCTEGSGRVHDEEQLKLVTDKPRLLFLNYELVRHSVSQKSSWTWRRTGLEMADWFHLLQEALRKSDAVRVNHLLTMMANQPGFHGVREQTKKLFDFAKKQGYSGELPKIYFVHKVAHGDPIYLVDKK